MEHQITTLNNGMRIVSTHMPHVETAAIGVWVDAGARHETEQMHGISHLLEHMAFKGTDARDARQIAEEIEAVGGHLNAYTSREQTAYFVRILKDDIPLAVDLLADILQNSIFNNNELECEKDVIYQEIGQALDTPDDLVFDRLQAAAFPDQPVGRPILGTLDSVASFTPDILRSHIAHYYPAPAMVLAAAGAIDHDRLVALAEERFSKLRNAPPADMSPADYRGGDSREQKELEQAHLVLAFEGIPYGDPDFYAGQVFTTVLGGGMSSRLFQEIREKRGLCYSIYAFSGSYTDTGLLGIYAGTGADSIGELIPVIADEMGALAGDAGAEETARGRTQLKAGLMMSLESPSACCEQLARQLMIYGRIIPTQELIAQVDAVDEKAVRRFAERVLTKGKPTVSALGPIARLESGAQVEARFG